MVFNCFAGNCNTLRDWHPSFSLIAFRYRVLKVIQKGSMQCVHRGHGADVRRRCPRGAPPSASSTNPSTRICIQHNPIRIASDRDAPPSVSSRIHRNPYLNPYVDPMSTQCRPNADPMSTQCRPDADPMPTRCRRNVDPGDIN